MANDFDQFPLYDNLTKNGTDNMSDVWIGSMSTFFQNLVGYLTQNGIFIPQITTTERDNIQTPVYGQMIYNTTTNEYQGYIATTPPAGSWKVFTLV
jgi:hypothetical protein